MKLFNYSSRALKEGEIRSSILLGIRAVKDLDVNLSYVELGVNQRCAKGTLCRPAVNVDFGVNLRYVDLDVNLCYVELGLN